MTSIGLLALQGDIYNLKSKKAEVPTIEIKKTSSVLNIFREFLTSHHQQLVKIDTLQETKLDFTY